MARRITAEDVASLKFEIGQLFTPSAPIKLADLFAGRQAQIGQMVSAVAEPGRHIVLYGERGTGKTSISQVLEYLVPVGKQSISYMRKACSPADTFDSIWRKFFKDMKFTIPDDAGRMVEHRVDEIYSTSITPDDVLREMGYFRAGEVPIFVIDEFNEITSGDAPNLMANTLKALSDDGNSATIVVVGVADNVTQLFAEHESISRCSEEVMMPRMSREELREIVDKRLPQLGMEIEQDALWKIVILSRGLPMYVHRLGKLSATRAVDDLRTTIVEEDVDASINEMLTGSLQSLRDKYEEATNSNQPGNLFKEVLLACALAKSDDNGYFQPAAVREPLSSILGKPMSIAQFQSHLASFHSEQRGSILQRVGEERSFRFRFREPAMQPYVLMKGIALGMVNEEAKAILRFPAQGELELQPPNASERPS